MTRLFTAPMFLIVSLAVLAACARAAAPAASAATPEIRIARHEGYGAVSMETIFRSDSVIVIKYFDVMQRPGDTIGVFKAPGDARAFARLWTTLEKGAGAQGMKPDTRVLSVRGVKDGVSKEYLIPNSPPLPDWARAFQNLADSLEAEATAYPYWGLALSVKPLSGKARQEAKIAARNPGKRRASLPKGAALKFQALAKPGPEGWPAGGPVWETLAEVKVDAERALPGGGSVELPAAVTWPRKGEWYYRVAFEAKGAMGADSSRVAGETISQIDSVAIR